MHHFSSNVELLDVARKHFLIFFFCFYSENISFLIRKDNEENKDQLKTVGSYFQCQDIIQYVQNHMSLWKKKCFKEPCISILKTSCKKIMNTPEVCPMTFPANEVAL